MSTYRGVVKGNTVVLPEDVDLAEGQYVEVRVISPGSHAGDGEGVEQIDREEEFLRHLVEVGRLAEIKRPGSTEPPGDRSPIEVAGKPLSETILEERR